jgi:hypothetical protein
MPEGFKRGTGPRAKHLANRMGQLENSLCLLAKGQRYARLILPLIYVDQGQAKRYCLSRDAGENRLEFREVLRS